MVVKMTELLKRAIARLKTLPPSDQNAITTLILEELEDDRRWDESFARSLICWQNWRLRQ